jgi:hypothetical protein
MLCLWRIRKKYLAVFGEHEARIEAYMKIKIKLGSFAVNKIVSEYVESI